MQITRAGEYAVLGLMCLARRPFGSVVMIDEVSREEHIPKSFAAKIFQSLVKAGLVQSTRGSGGGFVLLKKPDSITVLDVIEAIGATKMACPDLAAESAYFEALQAMQRAELDQGHLYLIGPEGRIKEFATDPAEPCLSCLARQ